MKGLGVSASSMSSSLSTHLLRLADVYLIYVEAVIGNQGSTTNEKARNVFWQVRNRAISEYKLPASVSWEDVWKERRLELACEGDRWYDFVRLSYYDPQKAINELVNQKRDVYDNLNNLYKLIMNQDRPYGTRLPISIIQVIRRFRMLLKSVLLCRSHRRMWCLIRI